MTSDERLAKLSDLRVIFESNDSPITRKKACLRILRIWAKEEGIKGCVHCHYSIFFAPYDYALVQGHVYSYDGRREVQITGLCEFCFDKIMAPLDEEDDEP